MHIATATHSNADKPSHSPSVTAVTAAAVSAAYTEDNGVWTLNDTAQLPELERIFIRPLVMYARLSEQGANTVLALRQQMQGGSILLGVLDGL